ncbi:MAG: DMT family transporter [Alphaproteobacteria bacterium]|nr:DMT family transporter [Alphaproteobacteria bacterium]
MTDRSSSHGHSGRFGFLTDNAYLLLALTTAMWGGNAVAGKASVGEVSPLSLVMFRWVGVALLMTVVAGQDVRRNWPVLKRHLPFLALLGTVGFTAFNSLFYIAAHSTTAINIGIVQGAIPIFVMLGAFVAFKTPVTMVQILGVLITVVGVAIVTTHGSLERLATLQFNPGDLIMVLACFFYASYTVALRKRPDVSGLSMFTVMAFAALLTSLPVVGYEMAIGEFFMPTAKGWLIILFVTIFPSCLAQIFFMRGVQLIGPGRAGMFANLVPIYAALFSVLLLGERFEVFHAVALVLVLAGIYVAERGKKER